MNKLFVSLSAVAVVAAFTVAGSDAAAQRTPSPTPVLKLAPAFDCAATVSGTSGKVTITKTNSATVDKTKDVVAVVSTPSGKVAAAVCGSAFGTTASVSFNAPATTDKSWIYTCSASQVSTTLACNPPK